MNLPEHDAAIIVRQFRNAHRAYDTAEQDYSTIEGCSTEGIVITPPDSYEPVRIPLDLAEKRYRPVRIPGLID
jgi:hypothetical protein